MTARDEAVKLFANILDNAAHGRHVKGRKDAEAGVELLVDHIITAAAEANAPAPKAKAAPRKTAARKKPAPPAEAHGAHESD